ncbi:UDP-glucose/GDP-mannose dehydrogenase family protein [Tenacibaculum sp. 190524A02b]|uniref:UDP-glucose dehydrogenase family protein n=1 Tax=Tenacibaculum vairaonense TaxID=3137860 RepID=UPI0031FA5A38
MNIAIVGVGYVGLVSGACFSEMGNKVFCVDLDKDKIDRLNKGEVPIYEPGLERMVVENLESGNLIFTTNVKEVINEVEVVFIAVGTPMDKDGSADLTGVMDVAEKIGEVLEKQLIVVNKSTVPVGTADKVREAIKIELDKRKIRVKFDIVSNPEFLKEGDAINDFMKPDRVVIGGDSELVFNKMKELYSPFFRTHDRFITMDVRSAEMTKYAANAMLATKISFMNEMANICEKVGADISNVRLGIGSDNRIGYSFIYPGIGYGGTCFPKDISAIKKVSLDQGYEPLIISAVEKVNEEQKKCFLNKIISRFSRDLSKYTFAVWGLSFKPGTDDMRKAPSIYIVKELCRMGAQLRVYDPKALKKAKEIYLKGERNVEYFEDKYEALKDADAMVLLTEWKEFRSPDFNKIIDRLKLPVIFDGRNQYLKNDLERRGIEYYRIGKV